MRDYHLEYVGIYDSLFQNLKCPLLLIYATPAPYGEKLFEQIMYIMSQIKQYTKSTIDLVPMEGTHHFHMLKPAETAEVIIKFLNEKVSLFCF